MSTKTFHTFLGKRLTFGSASEQIYVFNNPDSPNAFETVKPDGVTVEKVNQFFKTLSVSNPTLFDCFVSFNPNIEASPTAVNNVFRIPANDTVELQHHGGFVDLRIYLGGVGSIYITLK